MIEGQWLGPDKGTYDGTLWVELDKIGNRIKGYGARFEDDPSLPSTIVEIDIEDNFESKQIRVPTLSFDPSTGVILTPNQVKEMFPNGYPSTESELEIHFSDKDNMQVTWKSDIGTEGKGVLERAVVPERSKVIADAEISDWDTFKSRISRGGRGNSDQCLRWIA